MGIFSRLFKGGQDGNPPDDGSEDGSNGEATDTEPVAKADDLPDPSTNPAIVEPIREPMPPAPLPPKFAAAGSAPTASATLESNSMWAWPGPTVRRDGPAGAAPPSEPAPPPAPPQPPAKAPLPRPRTARTAAVEPPPQAETAKPEPPRAPEPPKPEPKPEPPPRAPDPPKVAAKPLVVESKSKKAEKRDPTMVMSPPPAPAPTPAPPVVANPVPAAPAPVRPKSDSVNSAFDEMLMQGESAKAGVSTAADLAEVRRVFEDVAAVHVGQVRDVMLELRYGSASPAWMDATRPALRSLRAMASQMELVDLCQALDDFCSTVETAVAGGTGIAEDKKTELLRRYQRLIELIPRAFELDAERDRREPIIVEALLYQVEGVEKPTIDKLFAVGLGKLDALLAANATDLAAVSGIRPALAGAIVGQFRAYRASANATLAAPDAMAERKQLGDLLITLSIQNDDYNRAAGGWTESDKAKKRDARKQREQTFQRIKVALARLGERDQLSRLEKMPFDQRITTLDKFLSVPPQAART
jgi:hypothetical protein